ncbi:hypothetical protein BD410DRAFT_50512 [Rickenella mellea]|uniref:Uncharacterized protein n=1 Tax=Rickenella mellea TaxID=50990 RepID=A0A4V3AZQ5_9AGAM|nr:hypothetical protein BD410DRAFT_50512 [Rickenella mellea]
MSTRRRTTVHDLASLRVRPDGTRVKNATPSLRSAASAARDAAGNWIASDAGGKGDVPRWRKKKKRLVEEQDEGGEVGGGDDGVVDGTRDEDEGEDTGPKDPRAKKRRRFLEDLTYLDAPLERSSQEVESAANDAASLPVPSSELLKCIHYYASRYYTARGELFDAAKEARREKKVRKMERLKNEGSSSRGSTDGRENEEGVESEDGDEQENEDGNENTDSVTGRAETEEADSKGSKVKKKVLRRDMYKAFDGSALMAIGMLIQEHIFSMMSTGPGEGWEDEMVALEEEKRVRSAARRKRIKSETREVGINEEEEVTDGGEEESDESEEDSSND